ncbi:MAG: glycosyltransferase family 2 protein [Candidatus Eisenbacteria bacterium]
MDVSVVIITFNCWHHLERCLRSLYKKVTGIDFEVIVIDNNSVDGTREHIKSEFPEITLIENPRNMGVARARNQGIRIARGRYVLILDADVEIVSDDFPSLLSYMDSHQEVGIAGCTLMAEDGCVHPSARTFPRPVHVLLRRLSYIGLVKTSRILKHHHLADWDRKAPRSVDMVEGAFQLIRKGVIDEIGLLDERMFYGFEDADYCARAIKAGYDVICYPAFIGIHFLQGITRGNPFNRMAVEHFRSYTRFYRKHRGLILSR